MNKVRRECLKTPRVIGAVKGKIGEVVESAGGKIVITSQSGHIHVSKAKLGDGKKVNGDALGIAVGTILGSLFLRSVRAESGSYQRFQAIHCLHSLEGAVLRAIPWSTSYFAARKARQLEFMVREL